MELRFLQTHWLESDFWSSMRMMVEFMKAECPTAPEDLILEHALRIWLAMSEPIGRG